MVIYWWESSLVALLASNVFLRQWFYFVLCTYVVRLYQNGLKKLEMAYNNSLRRSMEFLWRNRASEMFENLIKHSFIGWNA